MSNIVLVDNFTVSSPEFVIAGGTAIDATVPSANLIITPNQGYNVSANDFDVISSNPEVDVAASYFTQDGDNVILTVVFVNGAPMPFEDLDIKICMSGAAEEKGVRVEGDAFIETFNATPLPQNITYENDGPAESTETILSQLITADNGYYFQADPTISLRTGDATNYNLYTSNKIFDANNRLTAIRVNADYTYPFVNALTDEIDIYANAIAIPVIPIVITGYSVNGIVTAPAQDRDLLILGAAGANYELTISNGATFSNGTSTISGTIPNTGAGATETISFPQTGTSPTDPLFHVLDFDNPGSDLDPNYAGSWQFQFTRQLNSNIEITGVVNTSDSDLTVDNSNSLGLISNSSTTQFGYVDHTVTAALGIEIEWTNYTNIPATDFSKTEDAPNGTFNIAYGLKTINLISQSQRTLRVFVSTNNTSYQNMSYELNNNIETYITKTFTQKEFILDNSQSSSDTEYAYYDTSGVLQEPTLGPNATQTVCARLYPDQPSVTSGNGVIQLTITSCT